MVAKQQAKIELDKLALLNSDGGSGQNSELSTKIVKYESA